VSKTVKTSNTNTTLCIFKSHTRRERQREEDRAKWHNRRSARKKGGTKRKKEKRKSKHTNAKRRDFICHVKRKGGKRRASLHMCTEEKEKNGKPKKRGARKGEAERRRGKRGREGEREKGKGKRQEVSMYGRLCSKENVTRDLPTCI